jgi:D-alanine transaminase
MKEILANWNGTEMPLGEVRVSVLDRGFLFGDAVYEVLRVYHGCPFLQLEHMDRLRESLAELRISIDADALEKRVLETLSHSGVEDGLIYIQVTRGEAPRMHHFPIPAPRPNELIWVKDLGGDPLAGLRQKGAAAILIEDQRWKRCDIKSTNLLANCLASQEAQEADCEEALLVADDGTITEGSHTSVFGVSQGHLLTAPLDANILPGITRGLVLDLAERAGIPCMEKALTRDNLWEVDELFVTGTTAEVLPIVAVDDRPIGSGRPGPITAKLEAAYREEVRTVCIAESAAGK